MQRKTFLLIPLSSPVSFCWTIPLQHKNQVDKASHKQMWLIDTPEAPAAKTDQKPHSHTWLIAGKKLSLLDQ